MKQTKYHRGALFIEVTKVTGTMERWTIRLIHCPSRAYLKHCNMATEPTADDIDSLWSQFFRFIGAE